MTEEMRRKTKEPTFNRVVTIKTMLSLRKRCSKEGSMFRPSDGICTTSRRIATDMAQVEERNRAMMHAVTGRDQVFCRLRTEGHTSASKRGGGEDTHVKAAKAATNSAVCMPIG